jgi:hypothetical protein
VRGKTANNFVMVKATAICNFSVDPGKSTAVVDWHFSGWSMHVRAADKTRSGLFGWRIGETTVVVISGMAFGIPISIGPIS